jgi:uncharacterized membrane protein YhaH (DUF805 family)
MRRGEHLEPLLNTLVQKASEISYSQPRGARELVLSVSLVFCQQNEHAHGTYSTKLQWRLKDALPTYCMAEGCPLQLFLSFSLLFFLLCLVVLLKCCLSGMSRKYMQDSKQMEFQNWQFSNTKSKGTLAYLRLITGSRCVLTVFHLFVFNLCISPSPGHSAQRNMYLCALLWFESGLLLFCFYFLLFYDILLVLNQVSIAVKRHHDQGNSYKRQHCF